MTAFARHPHHLYDVCCTHPTTAPATPTTSPKSSRAFPEVKTAADFWAFSRAGRDLADLHLNYETLPPNPDAQVKIALPKDRTEPSAADYRVKKMKYAKVKDPDTGKSINDLTHIIYNEHIQVTHIPLAAHDYIVNGKSAIDWIIDRQCVSTDKASGITNDANDWATETMHNPRYPLDLLLSIITLSLETMKIVEGLPELDIE